MSARRTTIYVGQVPRFMGYLSVYDHIILNVTTMFLMRHLVFSFIGYINIKVYNKHVRRAHVKKNTTARFSSQS